MTPVPPPDPSLTSAQVLRAMAANDSTLFNELADIILRSLPNYAQALEQALSGNDTGAVRAALHKIKGTLQMVGASQTLNLLNTIGDHIRSTGTLPETGAIHTLLEQMRLIAIEVAAYPTGVST